MVNAVAEDPALSPDEKETVLRFSKSDYEIDVYSEESGLMRRLLAHPKFNPQEVRVFSEESRGTYVDPDDFEGGLITGVKGTLPIEALSVKTSMRATSQHAAVVSEQVLRGEMG